MEKGLIPWIVAAVILALAVNLAINAFTSLGETALKAMGKPCYEREAPNKTVTILKATTVTPSSTISASTQIQSKATKTATPAPELAFKTPESVGVEKGGDWSGFLSMVANITVSMIVAAVAFLVFRPRWI